MTNRVSHTGISRKDKGRPHGHPVTDQSAWSGRVCGGSVAPILGYTDRGSPIQPQRTVHGTKAQALEALDDLKRQVHSGHLGAESGTFADFLRKMAGSGIFPMEGQHIPPQQRHCEKAYRPRPRGQAYP